ncbi:zinc finger (CCCH type) motif-containing protein [Besnoitia besnoiti]|uniref:Zinc finger (CCCH type) motif-containing protein n=1 Tax=Besnoitia besnoiti TaxID=94643 RepID=A0A2A9M607_BESBE|nr:zinc finger (CCCH type) motif-containing protein [Besnoitia besnoiti]PFH33908.1 zinc finger (CCCH type) motif-containing protein [Besnoitia besnoiti]
MAPPPAAAAAGAAGSSQRQSMGPPPSSSSGASQQAAGAPGASSCASVRTPSSSPPRIASSTSPLIAASRSTGAFTAPYGPPLVDAPPPSSSGAPSVSLPPPSPGRFSGPGNTPSSAGLLPQVQPPLGGGGSAPAHGAPGGGVSRQRAGGGDRGGSGAPPVLTYGGALPGTGGNSALSGSRNGGGGGGGTGSLNEPPGGGGRGFGTQPQSVLGGVQELPHLRGNGGSNPAALFSFANTPSSFSSPVAAPQVPGAPGRPPPRSPAAGENRVVPSGAGLAHTHHKWRGGAAGAAQGGGGLNNNGNGSQGNSNTQRLYKTNLCPWFPLGRCTHGDQCSWAHSEHERRGFAGGSRSHVGGAPPASGAPGAGGDGGGRGRGGSAGIAGPVGQPHDGLVPPGAVGLGAAVLEGPEGHGVNNAGVVPQGQHHGVSGPRGGGALGAAPGGVAGTEGSAAGALLSDGALGPEAPQNRAGHVGGGSARGSSSGSPYQPHAPHPRGGGGEAGGLAGGRNSGGPVYSHHTKRENHEHAPDAVSGGASRNRGAPGAGDRPTHGQHFSDNSCPPVLFEGGGAHIGGSKNSRDVGGGILGTGHAGGDMRGGGDGHGGAYHHGAAGGLSHGPDKRRLCPYLSRKNGCYKGADCRFAHSEEEAVSAALRHQAAISGGGGLNTFVGSPVAASVAARGCGAEDVRVGEGPGDPAGGVLLPHHQGGEDSSLVRVCTGFEGAGLQPGVANLPPQTLPGTGDDDAAPRVEGNQTTGTAALPAGGSESGEKRLLAASGGGGGATSGTGTRGSSPALPPGAGAAGGAPLRAGTVPPSSGAAPGIHPSGAMQSSQTQGPIVTGSHSLRRGSHHGQRAVSSPQPGPLSGSGASPGSSRSRQQAPGNAAGLAPRGHLPPQQAPQNPMDNAVAAAAAAMGGQGAVPGMAAVRMPPNPASVGSYWLQVLHATPHPLPHTAQAGALLAPGGTAGPAGPLGAGCLPPFGGGGPVAAQPQQHALMMGGGGHHGGHPGAGMVPPGAPHGVFLASGTPAGGPAGPGSSGGVVGVLRVPVMQFLASTEELNAAAPLFYED